MAQLLCRDCLEPFTPRPGKPGFIDQCEDCGSAVDTPKVGGNMIWLHKTGPYIEIKPMKLAKRFASQSRRYGASVTSCLVEPQTERHKFGGTCNCPKCS